jgi:hypothetical protein
MNAILGGSEYCFSGYPGNDECVRIPVIMNGQTVPS